MGLCSSLINEGEEEILVGIFICRKVGYPSLFNFVAVTLVPPSPTLSILVFLMGEISDWGFIEFRICDDYCSILLFTWF